MKARQTAGNILIILMVLFTIYLAIIMVHRIQSVVQKDSYVKIFRYEIIICVLFLLFALDLRFIFLSHAKSGVLLIIGWALRLLIIAACAFCVFLLVRITVGSVIRSDGRANHAIVLGLALENGKPTDDLLARLDTAEQYAAENPEGMLVLTGGNPDESGKTEAAVMRDLLIQRGLPETKLILEDRAETTKENFRNTAKMIDPGSPVILISSNYHMDRAVRTAESVGFTQILRRPASSSALFFGANVMWEMMLELNEITLKQE